MMNRKGASTITEVIISLLVVMALFYGTFDYVITNYESANITDELGYNQSYADLQDAQDDLSDNIEDIKFAAQDISEADGRIVTVAWNGLTGIASTMRLTLSIIDVAVSVWNALLPGLAFLPTWVKLLMEMAIIITIVLIIVGAFKGEAKT